MRLSCRARNGRSPGEESLTAAIAVQAIEAQPAFGQIKPMRGWVLACTEQHFGDVPASDRFTQEAPVFAAKEKENLACKTAVSLLPSGQKSAHVPVTTGLQSAEDLPAQSK